ncbi:LPXTG cell wall anchor domain-containing protein (plasmid) [Enterococcus sp. 22-H-5-01]|uniref:LPXTG cell wall anchor domain-containing protein n=1 Tax=Enterococcus sp. 22-H-5-01 TaxID=3418555 RepID=UPI003CFE9B84
MINRPGALGNQLNQNIIKNNERNSKAQVTSDNKEYPKTGESQSNLFTILGAVVLLALSSLYYWKKSKDAANS